MKLEFNKGDRVFVRVGEGKLFEGTVASITNPEGPDTVIQVNGYGKPFYALHRPKDDAWAERYFIALRGDGQHAQLLPAIPEVLVQWRHQRAAEILEKLAEHTKAYSPSYSRGFTRLNQGDPFTDHFRKLVAELAELSAPVKVPEDA